MFEVLHRVLEFRKVVFVVRKPRLAAQHVEFEKTLGLFRPTVHRMVPSWKAPALTSSIGTYSLLSGKRDAAQEESQSRRACGMADSQGFDFLAASSSSVVSPSN